MLNPPGETPNPDCVQLRAGRVKYGFPRPTFQLRAVAIPAMHVQPEIVSLPQERKGGEKQLIQILTGKEVPHGQLAFDIGLFCQNVGTCVAITRALERDEPLISRVVTIAGDNISEPGNSHWLRFIILSSHPPPARSAKPPAC